MEKRFLLIAIVLFFTSLLGVSHAFLIEFTGYKKSFLNQKVYSVYNHSSEHEIEWADYKSFDFWDWYAHDKNHIYINWETKTDRITLDNSFEDFYDSKIFTKDNMVYYKNQYEDLIEITQEGNNLKVLYDTPSFIWVRSNNDFLNIDVDWSWFYNIAHVVDNEKLCNISNLEYQNWLYFDGKYICWYSYVVPKELINSVEENTISRLDTSYTFKLNQVHNRAYEKMRELQKARRWNQNIELKDKYLYVSIVYILDHIECNVREQGKNRIGCLDLQRRRWL